MLIGGINSVVGDSTDQLPSLLRRQFLCLLRSVDKRNLNKHQEQRESCEQDAENNSDDNNGGHGFILRTVGIEVGCSRWDLQGYIFKLGRVTQCARLKTFFFDIAILLGEY